MCRSQAARFAPEAALDHGQRGRPPRCRRARGPFVSLLQAVLVWPVLPPRLWILLETAPCTGVALWKAVFSFVARRGPRCYNGLPFHHYNRSLDALFGNRRMGRPCLVRSLGGCIGLGLRAATLKGGAPRLVHTHVSSSRLPERASPRRPEVVWAARASQGCDFRPFFHRCGMLCGRPAILPGSVRSDPAIAMRSGSQSASHGPTVRRNSRGWSVENEPSIRSFSRKGIVL